MDAKPDDVKTGLAHRVDTATGELRTFVPVTALKAQRGWTDRTIRFLLGAPDLIERNSDGELRLFELGQVERAEEVAADTARTVTSQLGVTVPKGPAPRALDRLGRRLRAAARSRGGLAPRPRLPGVLHSTGSG
jgi:hypothetical protein